MNESATNTMAIAPIANVRGAACPVACTTSVMLNAAVTVGEMTDSDSPTASGRLRRDASLANDALLRCGPSPHHIREYVRIRDQAPLDIVHGLIDDRESFLGLRLAQDQRRGEFQHVRAQADIEEHGPELVGPVDHLGARGDRYRRTGAL